MAAFMPSIRPPGRGRGARFSRACACRACDRRYRLAQGKQGGRGDAVHGFRADPVGGAARRARIGTGEALREAAAAESISFETARTRLKDIFDKTGTSRQAELAALVSRSVATPCLAMQGAVPRKARAGANRWRREKWWAMTGSNRRHLRCKRSALPTELIARSGPDL
jgi:hypothetical protein